MGRRILNNTKIYAILDLLRCGIAETSNDIAFALNMSKREVNNTISTYTGQKYKYIEKVYSKKAGVSNLYKYKITKAGINYLNIAEAGTIKGKKYQHNFKELIDWKVYHLHTKCFRPIGSF